MPVSHIALVKATDQLSADDLTSVGAVLQKQVTRDFAPVWNVQATVVAFTSGADVPPGYWQIRVQDDIAHEGVFGVHEDENGQPYALVQYTPEWALTASHECLEILADPSGRRLLSAPSVVEGDPDVLYLLEVCDPCQGAKNAYQIDGISVSDFYTPHYFDPQAADGVRYSFTGSISSPREVLRGGYLTWKDPFNNSWWQLNWLGDTPRTLSLGELPVAGRSLRSVVDREMRTRHSRKPKAPKKVSVVRELERRRRRRRG